MIEMNENGEYDVDILLRKFSRFDVNYYRNKKDNYYIYILDIYYKPEIIDRFRNENTVIDESLLQEFLNEEVNFLGGEIDFMNIDILEDKLYIVMCRRNTILSREIKDKRAEKLLLILHDIKHGCYNAIELIEKFNVEFPNWRNVESYAGKNAVDYLFEVVLDEEEWYE